MTHAFAIEPAAYQAFENEDEVIVYEPMSILEPDLNLGSAWPGYSNTLK